MTWVDRVYVGLERILACMRGNCCLPRGDLRLENVRLDCSAFIMDLSAFSSVVFIFGPIVLPFRLEIVCAGLRSVSCRFSTYFWRYELFMNIFRV